VERSVAFPPCTCWDNINFAICGERASVVPVTE
jgi:hypothetical protein